jgi:chromosome segregation ATPase
VTSSNERQGQQLASTLVWLEDTVRESKSQIARLQQQVEQSQGQVWDLAHRLQKAEEANVALLHELGATPRLEAELRSMADKLIRAEERAVSLETRLGETSRLHQIEADHIRSELSELVKRVDTFERPLQTWSTRLDTFEEMSRRGQEATTAARQRVDEVDRYVETVDGRIQRLADVIKRVDSEFALLVAEVESMQKQDASTADRFHAYAESLRRLEDGISVVAQQSDVRREFTEKFELQRSGIRRSEERLNLVEATADDVRGRLEDFTRSISLIEAREGNFRERLNEIFEEVAAYRAHLAEYFNKVTALDERQRRRRIEDLEREIRELKVHAYRPPEE